MGVIYKLVSPSNKIYIGQTISFRKRLNQYRALHCSKQSKIYCSLLKYGLSEHKIEVLEGNVAPEKLSEREKFWIKIFNSYYKNNPNGLNMSEGGSCAIWTKEKIMEHSDKFKGKNNPFYGKTHSEKNRKKYSENAKIQFKGYIPPVHVKEKALKARRKPMVVFDIIEGIEIEYQSLTATAIALGVDPTTVRDVLRTKGRVKKRYKVSYKNTPCIVGDDLKS